MEKTSGSNSWNLIRKDDVERRVGPEGGVVGIRECGWGCGQEKNG